MGIQKFATVCVVCRNILPPLIGSAATTLTYAQTVYVPVAQYEASAIDETNVPEATCNFNPAVTFRLSCENIIFAPGSVASPLGSSVGGASLTGSTDPILHASGSGNADSTSGVYGGGAAEETFYFAIHPGLGLGGPAPTGVLLDFSAEGSAVGNANWVAQLNSYDDASLVWTETFGECQSPESVCNQKLDVPIGRLYGVLLTVAAGPGETEPTLVDGHIGTETLSAGVAGLDPIVSIDPGFLAAHPGYSLVFGATSPSSVPEPSTWVMLGLGFAGLGYAGLRGRRAALGLG